MSELGINDINEQPASEIIPCNFKMATKDKKRQLLRSLAEQVVNKYILGCEKVASILDKVHMAEVKDKETKNKNADARFKCKFPGCDKTYKYDGKRESMKLPMVYHLSQSYGAHRKKIKKRDDMFNYQSSFSEIGLLVKNYFDAVSHGDSRRVIRCWKFMLPYLRQDGSGSRKYALEALYLQCQVNALLRPRAAHRLTWNRFFKSKYGMAGNIPLDFALEHFNCIIKTLTKKLGANGLRRL